MLEVELLTCLHRAMAATVNVLADVKGPSTAAAYDEMWRLVRLILSCAQGRC